MTLVDAEALLTDITKLPVAAAGGGAGDARSAPSSYSSDKVNSSQFIQLLDLFLADIDDDQLTRQLLTFVCEGFVQSKDQRTLRRQQVHDHSYPEFNSGDHWFPRI